MQIGITDWHITLGTIVQCGTILHCIAQISLHQLALICLLLESEYNESKNKTNDENNQNPLEYIQPNVHVYTKECQGKIRYIHVNIQKIKYFKMLKFV